jgi:histidine triad (HIT) family protein
MIDVRCPMFGVQCYKKVLVRLTLHLRQLMQMTIFKKIIDKEIPAQIVFEDEHCLAFKDINPQAPIHILLIPKITEIDRLSHAQVKHQEILGHLMLKAGEIAKQQDLSDFRIVINDGEAAGQSVFHLHIHILGGRDLAWPPG